MERQELLQNIQKARTQLVLDHPFFATLALPLALHPSHQVETLTTDGRSILYNPQYVKTLNVEEIKGCLAHLVMHCALGHTWRGEAKEDTIWQRATDYAVNGELLRAGFALPQGHLYSDAYKNMNAEQIYELLYKQAKPAQNNNSQPQEQEEQAQQQNKQSQKQDNRQSKQKGKKSEQQDKKQSKQKDPGRCGAAVPPPPSNKNQEQQRWKTRAAQALLFAEQQGNLPGSLERMIREEIAPKLHWTTLLRDFVERSARNDYNWSRVASKHLLRGFVLPTLISEELPRVLIAVDTSMSITETQLSRFATEVSSILMAYRTITEVVYCDAKVQNVEVFTSEELPIQLHPQGGGGTDFRPVFEYVQNSPEQFACIIFFTDLQGQFPTREPDQYLLWVSTTEQEAPIGETVHF